MKKQFIILETIALFVEEQMEYLEDRKKSEQNKKLEEEVLQWARKKPGNKPSKAETEEMIDEKQSPFFELGIISILIGFILLIFGFWGETWVHEQMFNSMSSSIDVYKFWINVDSFRKICQPLSIVLLIVGGILLFYSLSYQDYSKKNSMKTDEPIKFLKIRYAKGEITKEKYEQMKKEIED